jgi:hypothetical protein
MFDTRQTLLTLLLPEAMKKEDKKVTPWDILERWWTGAAEFAYPISVTEGSAVFKAEAFIQAVPFSATYP